VTWVKLDDGFPEHSKILAAGPYGLAVHVRALCWAARNLSDGYLPAAAVKTFTADFGEIRGRHRARKETVESLVSLGIWEQEAGGYRIHDYLDFNPSKSEVLAGREKVSGRVKDWRDRKRNATGNAVTRHHVTPSVTPLQMKCNAVGNAAPVPGPLPSPTGNEEVISEGGETRSRTPAFSGVAVGRDPFGPDTLPEVRAAAEKRRLGDAWFESAGVSRKPEPWLTALSYGPDSRSDERERLLLWEAGDDAAFTRHVAERAFEMGPTP
jgi:hypothetical protein